MKKSIKETKEELKNKFRNLNNEVERLQKPISSQALSHFGVIEQLEASRDDFTKELLKDSKYKLTYLNKEYKSYFLPTYKKHVKFAIEEKEQYFKNKPVFGNISTLEIKKDFDYLNKMVLCFSLPTLKIKDKFKIQILNSIIEGLGIDYKINSLKDNKESILNRLNNKIKIKYAEMKNNLDILNKLYGNLKYLKVHSLFNHKENLIIFLMLFILNNKEYLNIDTDIYNIIIYLLNSLSFYKLNDYIIDSLYNFETYTIEDIINSINNKRFKEDIKNNKNCLYLLQSNLNILEILNKRYKIKDIGDTFKVQLKRNNKNSKYIIHNLNLFTYEKFKEYLFINQFKSLEFKTFTENYKDILNLNDSLFTLKYKYNRNIKNIERIGKNYNHFINAKYKDNFNDSVNYINQILNYLYNSVYNLNTENIKKELLKTIDKTSKFQYKEFILFNNIKKANDKEEFISLLFESFNIFTDYFFYDLISLLKIEDYKNNKTLFKHIISDVLNIWLKFTENKDNKSLINSPYIEKIKDNLILSLNDTDKMHNNFTINQIFNYDIERLKTILFNPKDEEIKFIDLTNSETVKDSLFKIFKDIICFIFPFFNLDIENNINKTIYNYIEDIIKTNIDNLNKQIKRYNKLFTDSINDNINTFDYFFNIEYKTDIALNIFDYMEITCDNQIISRLGNEYYKIYYSLHEKGEHRSGINKIFNSKDNIYYLPLHFFFNDYSELSLPLLCLKNSTLNFNIKFKEFTDLINSTLIDLKFIKPEIFEQFKFKAFMILKYIIIEQPEALKIINKPFKLLIHQFQYSGSYYINNSNLTALLNLKNPVKYIIIYTPEIDFNPFETLQIHFDNYQITNKINLDYYNICSKLNYFNNCKDDNIYIINYSLYPEQLQPSGSFNYSMINKVSFTFKLKDNLKMNNVKVQIYALAYNYFNIVNGQGILEFES